jgi:serine/threonine protein kinase/tetratricopeptide (TPR) repeat protein
VLVTREERVAGILAAWRERVERGEFADPAELLRAHPDLAGELRQHLAMHEVLVAAGAAGGLPPMSRVGEYRIVREIGRGGMGVVYEAEQTTMHRRVALKVLFPSVTNSAAAVQRFHHEARAAGRLKHTNIVAVHQLGQEGGVWYCAMELVDGRSLADVIRELRDARRPPSESRLARRTLELATPAPSWTGRETGTRAYYLRIAEMFAEVAEALQVAHNQGVVHRDIKPANLLLDTQGRLKIADFGLARLDEEASVTRTGDVVGTPLYMSPEQLAGRRSEVDGRSDVYSLGATLYETLALRPTFAGTSPAGIAAAVLQRDPAPLRRRDTTIPRDLETIVHKALEKDRSRRYSSAGAMAQDLRGFALGEAIRARHVGPLGRAWRMARRRKAIVALAATLVVALVAVSLLAWRGRLQQADLAREASRRRELEYFALCAEARLAITSHGGDASEIYSQAIALLPERPEAYLGRMLHGGLPTEERLRDLEAAAAAGASPRTLHLARAHVLRQQGDGNADAAGQEEAEAARHPATDRLSAVLEAHMTSAGPDVRERITRVLETTDPGSPERFLLLTDRGLSAMSMGEFADAIADYHAACAIHPDFKIRCWIAECWQRLGQSQKADEVIEEVLRDARAAGTPRPWADIAHACIHWRTWGERVTAEALKEFPDSPELLMLRGRALKKAGRLGEALQQLDLALRIDASFAKAREERAGVLLKMKRYAEAAADAETAIAGLPYSHRAHEFRGGALVNLGRRDEAIRMMRRAIELQPGCATAHAELAEMLPVQGQADEALRLSRRAVDLDANDPIAWAAVGVVLARTGQWDESLKAFDRSLELDRSSPSVHFNRGQALCAAGKTEEAFSAFESAIALDPSLAASHARRGDMLFDLGRCEEATREYEKAIEIDPGDVTVRANLALALAEIGQATRGLAVIDDALAVVPRDRKVGSRAVPAQALLRHTRAEVLCKLDRIEDAAADYARAVADGFDDPVAHWSLAMCYRRLGKWKEMAAACEEYTRRVPEDLKGWGWRGAALEQLGHTREAVLAFEQAIRLGSTDPRSCNTVAWYRATAADPAERDGARAVRAARCVVEAFPDRGGAWNTLGAAHYAAGSHEESLKALAKAVELKNGGDACDWLFTAMAHGKLGHADEARAYYDRAVAWMGEHPTEDEELPRFRKEAESVLGIR